METSAAFTSDGENLPSKGKIHVRWVRSAHYMWDSLIHELVHATFTNSGLGDVLKRKLNLTHEQWVEVEEDIARVFTPALLSTLRRAGWLTLPQPPPK